MNDKDKKIKGLINNNRIFRLSETDKKIYFIVKGTKRSYVVIYDKLRDNWICPCNNIRLTDCYHIEGCKEVI